MCHLKNSTSGQFYSFGLLVSWPVEYKSCPVMSVCVGPSVTSPDPELQNLGILGAESQKPLQRARNFGSMVVFVEIFTDIHTVLLLNSLKFLFLLIFFIT